MYAIIEAGGKQYRVSEGDLIDVERRSGEVGQAIDFQEVLLIGDQETIHVGKPVLAGARVVGTIAEQGKKAKIIVFKFKRRKKYRKKQGHRQLFTRVRIDQIELDGQKPKAEKTQQAITKAKEVTGAVAKAPATAKDKAVKTSAKTSKKAAPKAATKKKTKSVKKTAKKSTKKTVTKKN
ncbi:MAG: 50S ribosomal protein L21 [Acidobacteria bacterium]|nr:MAG: 50S ribosomal protein L21 [Acidobacteriota bacterium]